MSPEGRYVNFELNTINHIFIKLKNEIQLSYAVDKKTNASFSSYIYMVLKSFETNVI